MSDENYSLANYDLTSFRATEVENHSCPKIFDALNFDSIPVNPFEHFVINPANGLTWNNQPMRRCYQDHAERVRSRKICVKCQKTCCIDHSVGVCHPCYKVLDEAVNQFTV